MRILQTQVYKGASLWAPVPVIRFSVEIGALAGRFTNAIPTFHEKLTATLPNLREHECSTDGGDRFIDRVNKGTGMGHVIQHVALEMQHMAGQRVDGGNTCLAVELDDETTATCDAIFQYEQQDVGLAAGQFAVRLLKSFLQPEKETVFDFANDLKEFLRLAAKLSYGPSTRALVAEARRRNIPVQRLEDSLERVQLGRGTRALRSLLQLGYGKYQRHIWAPYISTESHLAADIALNKDLTNRLVRNAGLPVPRSIRVKDEEGAVAAANEIGYPVVLKPLDGNHGRGVGVNLQHEAAVRSHYPLAKGETHTGTVLVEKFIPGNTYRILVVGGHAVAATEEVPAHVVGDGLHTLRQLVKLTNADPRRGHGSENLLVRIRLDETALALAQKQGYGPDDIPPKRAHVQLARTAHISLGGISVDRTDEVHPYNAMIAEQAAQVIGLQVAGIDIVAPDIAASVQETGGAICEVNAGPGLGLHIEPVEGKPRDVARPVIELLFPPGATSRVPIVAVTGTDGRTSTSRMVAHILSSAGRRVGLATTDAAYFGVTPLIPTEMSDPDPARTVLRNPAIDTAVLEIEYESILYCGLAYDSADVVLITQGYNHPLASQYIEPSRDFMRLNDVVAKSVSTDGQLVLNADDEGCLQIGSKARVRIVYYTRVPGNLAVERHVRAGGRAVVVRRVSDTDRFFLIDGGATDFFLGDTPATPEQCDRSGNANVLGAVAACAALALVGSTPIMAYPA
ncbi:MAG TPA: acetate--CoA ligase family protein [Chthoniobacterales bacterium]